MALGVVGTACGTPLTPVQFAAPVPAKDALDAAARALAVEGQSVAARDNSAGTLETTWQQTKYPGWGGHGRVVRRYRVIASGARTVVVVRADAMSCPEGMVALGQAEVMTSCSESPAVPAGVQEDLETVAAKVRAAVAQSSPGAGAPVPVASGSNDTGTSPGPVAPSSPEPQQRAPQLDSGIAVRVVEAARVLVDGADAGRAEPGVPLALTLPPGDYKIRVAYEGGGNEKRKVLVTYGHVTDINFQKLPDERLVFDHRSKWLRGFTLGGGVYTPDLAGIGPQFAGGFVMNRGLSRAVDFRVLAGLHGWVADVDGLAGTETRNAVAQGLGLSATVEPGFVFHLGSMFTMGVGVGARLGVAIPLSVRSYGPDLGPGVTSQTKIVAGAIARASPAGVAFGASREHHIELVGGVGASSLGGLILDMGELRYSLLFP